MQRIEGGELLTDPAAYGDEQLPHRLRVVHHDGLHRAVQHLDLLGPLLLLVLQDILTEGTHRDPEQQQQQQTPTIPLSQ